jgi:hypothetical protein
MEPIFPIGVKEGETRICMILETFLRRSKRSSCYNYSTFLQVILSAPAYAHTKVKLGQKLYKKTLFLSHFVSPFHTTCRVLFRSEAPSTARANTGDHYWLVGEADVVHERVGVVHGWGRPEVFLYCISQRSASLETDRNSSRDDVIQGKVR